MGVGYCVFVGSTTATKSACCSVVVFFDASPITNRHVGLCCLLDASSLTIGILVHWYFRLTHHRPSLCMLVCGYSVRRTTANNLDTLLMGFSSAVSTLSGQHAGLCISRLTHHREVDTLVEVFSFDASPLVNTHLCLLCFV